MGEEMEGIEVRERALAGERCVQISCVVSQQWGVSDRALARRGTKTEYGETI